MAFFLNKHSRTILIIICVVSFFMMLSVSLQESAIVDELAHIPAGYSYVHYLDYRLNPEHPPLLKALAALPLLVLDLKFPLNNSFWTTAVNGEWGVGGAFLYGLGNSAAEIIQVARIVPMLFTIALILLTYIWARRLFGRAWALLPAFLLGLSPVIIAQGHYVTTDVAAAFGTVLSLFTFTLYIDEPRAKYLWLAGIGLGVAELVKVSNVLLFVILPVLMVFHYGAAAYHDRSSIAFGERRRFFLRRARHYFGALVAMFAIALVLVVYPVYALFIAHYPADRQLSDTASPIGYLAAAPCSLSNITTCAAQFDLWSAHHAFTRPVAEYLLGILMVFQRITGNSASYFLGYVYQNGSHLYFPATFALKETVPTLVIVFLGSLFAVIGIIRAIAQKRSRFAQYIVERFPQFAMITFVAIYWAVSIQSPLNIGVRHLLPTIPLIYLLATSALAAWAETVRRSGRHRTIARGAVVLGALLIWFAGETAFAYPYYTSYFNEFGGGTANGYRSITDSNYDWGQDMLRLQSWMNANPQVNKIALDFFGASNPSYYLGDKYVAWNASMGDPRSQGITWFAVSINNLQLAIQPPAGSSPSSTSSNYQWLLNLRPKEPGMGGVPAPDYRVGTTIFIYKLSP